MQKYNEDWPRDALEDISSIEYMLAKITLENSTLALDQLGDTYI